MHGNGKLTTPNGTIYLGEYVEGRNHGPGKCFMPDGSVIEG